MVFPFPYTPEKRVTITLVGRYIYVSIKDERLVRVQGAIEMLIKIS